MCGIVGYIGGEGAADRVFDGLKILEYRGYDSAGISVVSGGEIHTVKHAGRVDSLRGDLPSLQGSIAIGHTRWATHGEPADRNAHPHAFGMFSAAHNGIIENYAQLKQELISDGAEFMSDTDSEVVTRLLNRYYEGDPLKAVQRTVGRLKGSYALAIVCSELDAVIAVKYKSPVIIGYGAGETYIASDIPAMPVCVGEITVLEDGDIAVVTRSGANVFDGAFNRVKRERMDIPPQRESVELCGYPHFMIKEIGEEGRTIRDTVRAFSDCDVRKIKERLIAADKVIITGCGTAYNSGLIGKRYFARRGINCSAEIASELRYFPEKVTEKSVVIAVSQSGETADTVEAASALSALGACVIAVTNAAYSAITRVADIVVPVRAGCEICVAATKSYLGQLVCLYLLSNVCTDGVERAQKELYSVAEQIEGVISLDRRADAIAACCAESRAVFFLGRGLDYAAAVEGSLKLKEVSYVFSDAYPAGELKHGTLALIDESVLSVIIICDESTAEKCENAVEQIASRKGRVAVVTSLGGVESRLKDRADFFYLLPPSSASLAPFYAAAALQLIAYKTAVLRGLDPDKPRNLAKSVTVE